MNLIGLEGKHTVETLARTRRITRQSAINLLSRLKKQGRAHASGGGRQKRIYTITLLPQRPTNGFYDLVNLYSPEKLVPAFAHYVHGRYTVEDAIIDGLRIGDTRTRVATMHLFNHVRNWTRLFALARKEHLTEDVRDLYRQAQKRIRVRRMPARYA